MTSPGLADVSSISHSPGVRGWATGLWAGLGQAAHREPLWGGIMQHQGRSMQPHTHPWPNQGPKDS